MRADVYASRSTATSRSVASFTVIRTSSPTPMVRMVIETSRCQVGTAWQVSTFGRRLTLTIRQMWMHRGRCVPVQGLRLALPCSPDVRMWDSRMIETEDASSDPRECSGRSIGIARPDHVATFLDIRGSSRRRSQGRRQPPQAVEGSAGQSLRWDCQHDAGEYDPTASTSANSTRRPRQTRRSYPRSWNRRRRWTAKSSAAHTSIRPLKRRSARSAARIDLAHDAFATTIPCTTCGRRPARPRSRSPRRIDLAYDYFLDGGAIRVGTVARSS